jgi:hypothetical protein
MSQPKFESEDKRFLNQAVKLEINNYRKRATKQFSSTKNRSEIMNSASLDTRDEVMRCFEVERMKL